MTLILADPGANRSLVVLLLFRMAQVSGISVIARTSSDFTRPGQAKRLTNPGQNEKRTFWLKKEIL